MTLPDDDSDFSDGNVATIPSPLTTQFKHENVEGGATGPTGARVLPSRGNTAFKL